ncbi:MAG: glyoxalase [Acidimicrobiales bacterium]|nr:glyoxalase [Acidimicrobiales bacterium]
MPPTIDELLIADDPDAWRATGFTVDPDGVCRIGTVRVRLDPDAGRRGVRAWSLRGVPDDRAVSLADAGVDGLRTAVSPEPPADPAEHPIGARLIDHVVVLTPDLPRTIAAVQGLGLELKRIRDTDTYGAPLQQAFFRLGEVILEVVGPAEPQPNGGPARFFGIALTLDDLDAAKALLGDRAGTPKPAVQPGRRICTIKESAGLRVAVALMSPEPPGAGPGE